jgi:hypothetical protein
VFQSPGLLKRPKPMKSFPECTLLLRITENHDDRVSAQKHFADEAVSIHWLRCFLTTTRLGNLQAMRKIGLCRMQDRADDMLQQFCNCLRTSVHISFTFSKSMLQ